jgi:hypothetical protein
MSKPICPNSLNFLATVSLINALLSQNLVPSLVRKLQIFLDGHGVFDCHEHDRQSNEQATCQQAPRRSKLADVGDLQTVETPDDGGACGLDALVETGVVGEFAAVVGHGAHEPVDGALPGSVVEAL